MMPYIILGNIPKVPAKVSESAAIYFLILLPADIKGSGVFFSSEITLVWHIIWNILSGQFSDLLT